MKHAQRSAGLSVKEANRILRNSQLHLRATGTKVVAMTESQIGPCLVAIAQRCAHTFIILPVLPVEATQLNAEDIERLCPLNLSIHDDLRAGALGTAWHIRINVNVHHATLFTEVREHAHVHVVASIATQSDVGGVAAWAVHFEHHPHDIIPFPSGLHIGN